MPDGLDPGALVRYCLALGDDALIYSHRLQQWVARLPELEEETAVANIALDLLGQARLLLARAGGIVGQTEDQLAFFREEKDFRNVRLAEHADRDFAELVVRLLLFSTWRLALFEALLPPARADPVLAAIAAKGVNELAYHRDYAAGWVVRLGDGTALSHAKTQAALDALWPLAGRAVPPRPRRAPFIPGGASTAAPSTPCSTPSWPRRASTARRRAARRGRRPGRPRRRAHRGDGLHPRRAPVRRPRPPGRDMVTRRPAARTTRQPRPAEPGRRRHRDTAHARVRRRRRHPGPGDPDADHRRPRHPPLRRLLTRPGTVVTITPTYSGCPAMREIAADVQAPPQPGRLRARHRRDPAQPAVEHRLDHRGRPPQARRRRHRPAVRRAAPRPARSR